MRPMHFDFCSVCGSALGLFVSSVFILLFPCKADAFLYPQMFSRDNPMEIMRQADAALADKAMQAAVDLYTAAINTGDLDPPDAAVAYERRGRAWLALGRPHQTLADLRRSIELAPQRASAFAWRARAWEALDMSEEALRDADAAVHACPGCAGPLLLRARLKHQAGDADGAAKDQEAASKRSIPHPTGHLEQFPE